MPTLAPITGQTSLRVGSTTTFSDATPAGTWSSSNTGIITINAATGLATAISQGSANIIYTVGSDSMAIQVNVTPVASLTNGFNFDVVYNALKNRVLWQSQGVISDSQRYYEDFHPLNDSAVLDQMRPPSTIPLATYLDNKQRAVVMEAINAVYNAPQVVDPAKLAFYRQDLPVAVFPVANAGQFVGLKLFVGQGDYAVKINSVELFFNKTITFDLYLWNDLFLNYTKVKAVTSSANSTVIVDLGEEYTLNNLTTTYKGGRWYLGYFQDDIAAQGAQALYYNINIQTFHPLSLITFAAPVVLDGNGNRNFSRNNIGQNNLMYGLNAEISTYVDATNNIVQNRHLWDELLGLLMAKKNVTDMIYSFRSNDVERAIKGNTQLQQLYAELNGYSAGDEIPYVLGLKDRVSREIQRVKQGFQKKQITHVGTA